MQITVIFLGKWGEAIHNESRSQLFAAESNLTFREHHQNRNRGINYYYFQEVVTVLDHVRTHEQCLSFMLPRNRKLFLEKPGQALFYLPLK